LEEVSVRFEDPHAADILDEKVEDGKAEKLLDAQVR
jgi:hypothetical protein